MTVSFCDYLQITQMIFQEKEDSPYGYFVDLFIVFVEV